MAASRKLIAALVPVLAGCVLTLHSSAVLAADVANGKRIFQKCGSCHSLATDSNGFGPTLRGVLGRQAGSLPQYQFSSAMKAAGSAGLVWDEAALAEFLASPKTKVPGTSMRFWGFWFQSEIDDVVAYIKANQ